MDNNIFEVFTDGSCNTKLNIGAWAAIIINNDTIKTISDYALETTNNRMELTAIIKAVEYIETNFENIEKIDLYSDSQYVVNLPEREKKFVENDFLTKKGEYIQNVDLVKKILDLYHKHNINFEKVKAHQKKTEEKNYNIDVDKLSRKIVREFVRKNNFEDEK
ncbi:MAG: ribonuclease HI [Bacteroidales bacterium]|nr:ribonuclease HI [Bacteroidales bacterium]MBN2757177.1 ribonuclease HI [Bacteroidales bacterium]